MKNNRHGAKQRNTAYPLQSGFQGLGRKIRFLAPKHLPISDVSGLENGSQAKYLGASRRDAPKSQKLQSEVKKMVLTHFKSIKPEALQTSNIARLLTKIYLVIPT